MPGATISANRSNTWATMSPEARILSISDLDLRMIIRRCRSVARLKSTRVKSCLPPQCAYDSPEYVLGSPCPVNLVQTARLSIVIKQRPRLFVIKREPLSYCLFVIIRSGEQLLAVQITNAFLFTWLEVDVVYRPAGAACLPPRQPLEQQLSRHLDAYDGNPMPEGFRDPLQQFHLRKRSRKTIEYATTFAIRSAQTSLHNFGKDVV